MQGNKLTGWRVLGGWYAEAGRSVRRQAWPLAAGVAGVLAAAAALALSGTDRGLADWFTTGRPEGMIAFAKAVSKWGELHLAPFLALLALGLVGWKAGRSRWVWAAVAGLLGGTSAGVGAIFFKVVFGRPRPHLQVTDEFTWFARAASYQSFPSGHTTHCFGVAVAVLVLAPRWGAGFVAAATLVAWSRMYLGSHYLSDVVAGTGLGTLVGAVLALAIRRWLAARDAGKAPLTP
jgi:membrane-associated phospholipid phosphatase